MIIDTLQNATLYKGLGNKINQAFEYLRFTNFAQTESGQYEIEGMDVFAIVSRYESKAETLGLWEAHRQHIDVQYIAEGVEQIKVTNIGRVSLIKEYDKEKDFAIFEGKGDFITLHTGSFAIFYPDDVHMPGIQLEQIVPVLKVVVKVRLDGLIK